MIDAVTVERHGFPGHLRSVPDEIDATSLPVTGVLPPGLTGRYLRNGPNALPGQTTVHFQVGPGMLHGVRLREGRAEWYRNRWIRTAAFHGRPYAGAGGRLDLTAVPANTHVIEHARRIFALVEAGLPYEVSPDLDTVGPCDFGGRLTTAMTAHPKRDPATGDLHFFGYGMFPPHLTYHRLDAKGELVHSREVAVPASTMTHDFAITGRHCVWLDLPLTFRRDLLGRGVPYQWDDGYGARIGLMRHDVPGAPVRWFDVDPCFVMHTGNAHEDADGRVVLEGIRYSPGEFATLWGLMTRTAELTGPRARAARGVLHRWTLDPGTGRVTEEALDDQEIEFPAVDGDRLGRPTRYLYAVTGTDPRTQAPCAILKYDLTTGHATRYHLDPDTVIGEPVFTPTTSDLPTPTTGEAAPSSLAGARRAEDDGWLLAVATRRDGGASRLLVLDAADLAAGPVAAVELPRGVPTGFHGSWFPD